MRCHSPSKDAFLPKKKIDFLGKFREGKVCEARSLQLELEFKPSCSGLGWVR